MNFIIGMLLNILGMIILSCILGITHMLSIEWWFVILAASVFNIAGSVINK